MRDGITALLTAHPARLTNGFLDRALQSVTAQTLQPAAIIVVNDIEKQGAGHTRQRALAQVQTKWLAWLDSDDFWDRDHLEKLWKCAEDTDSVYVYSWFRAAYDPLGHFGKVFDPCAPHHTTTVALVRTDVAQEAGVPESRLNHPVSDEDWGFISRVSALCCERGWKMTHLPEKTWTWVQGGQNTSGLPNRGDAFHGKG